MSRILKALSAAVIVFFLLSLCLRKVPLDKVGVVIDTFGGGVQERDREAGFHWIWPMFQTLVLWDPSAQVIHLEQGDGTDSRVHIRGKDQYTTHLDMTVVFRIKRNAEGKTSAWFVAKKLGSIEKAREIALRNANKVIWEVMSELATEEFYDTDKRHAHAETAWEKLNKALQEEGLEIVDILVRKIDYDPSFEARLLEKQLLEQDQLLQTSLAKAEKEKQVTEKIQKETEATVKRIAQERDRDVKVILAEKEKKLRQIEGDTQLYTTKIDAEARLELKRKTADGNLLVDRARAKGEEAINKAYQQSGGEYLLGRRILEGIEFGTIEINTNLWNPFDIQDTLRKILGAAADPAAK